MAVKQRETGEAEVAQTAAPEKAQTVKIKLHKGRSQQEADDVFVSVNGERFQIQRGVEVEVPYYVAEVLEHSERQDLAAIAYRERLEKQFTDSLGR